MIGDVNAVGGHLRTSGEAEADEHQAVGQCSEDSDCDDHCLVGQHGAGCSASGSGAWIQFRRRRRGIVAVTSRLGGRVARPVSGERRRESCWQFRTVETRLDTAKSDNKTYDARKITTNVIPFGRVLLHPVPCTINLHVCTQSPVYSFQRY